MKLVIPYRLTPDNGLELRYALRSMHQFFQGCTGVILIGQKPNWYTGEHIPADDIPGRKEFSIYSKLMRVQDTVMFSNDDIFALQPFDIHLPNYYEATCGDKRPADITYRKLYDNCPAHWYDYDIHCPMVIDTRRFEWYSDRPLKSYYGNQNNVAPTRGEDCKIRDASHVSRIKGKRFFSTYDKNGIAPAIHRLLKQLYPVPSPYESAQTL